LKEGEFYGPYIGQGIPGRLNPFTLLALSNFLAKRKLGLGIREMVG